MAAAALPRLPATVRSSGYEAPRGVVLPHPSILPKQPGNNWEDTAFKKSHKKKQTLLAEGAGDYGRVYKPTFVRTAPVQPELSQETLRLADCLTHTSAPTDDAPAAPTVEGRVLRFYGFWAEAPVESAEESTRVRPVTVCFFPHDETVMVSEPKVPNSGMQGGTLVKRQRVLADRGPRRQYDSSEIHEHLTVDDFNVGEEVNIYGKRIHICDADAATREFLEALGTEVPPPERLPPDEYFTQHREKRVNPKRATRTYDDFDLRTTFEQQSKGRVVKHYPDEIQRVRKFLQDGGKVCRFWAYWDDQRNPHGDLRRYELRYFIEDDTIEVVERIGANAGREVGRAFRRRCHLPIDVDQQRKGLELTFASRVNGIRHDAPPAGGRPAYYRLHDLDIGSTVNVFSRELVIYATDAWTREYFEKQLGRPMEPDRPFPGNAEKQVPALAPPRHNGYGTEEDSLGNCFSLVLKPPKQDLKKWQQHADDVLRFKMKFHAPGDANDVHRRFVLSFYLADDTLTISEASIRNSGFLAGRFLKRQRVKKYAGEGKGTWFSAEDFFPGAVVNISGHTFEIIDMDRRTEVLKDPSLQQEAPVTPQRVAELAHQLRRALMTKHMMLTDAFRHFDRDKDGCIALHEFRSMLQSLHMTHVSDREVVAVMQQWNTNGDGKLSLNEFVAGVTGDTLKSLLDGAEAEFGKVPAEQRDDTPYHDVARQRPMDHERRRVLRVFKETLESRQINVFEMYRMLSTMPASYSSNPNGVRDAECLTSGGADSLLGPVQLRRGIEERFTLGLSEAQLDDLVAFFFPGIPQELMKAPRSKTQQWRLSLADFQERWNAMEQIGQLPASDRLDAHSLTPF